MTEHWPRTAEALRAAAEQRGGTAYFGRRGESVTLAHPGLAGSIGVEDMGEDGARIKAGWLIDILADCDEQTDRPAQVVKFVAAIMDGGAEEVVYCDEVSGSWVGQQVAIHHDEGTAHSGLEQPSGSRAFIRRLPAWI